MSCTFSYQYNPFSTSFRLKQEVLEGEDAKIPEFLSDHPASEARIADIESEAKKLQCSTKMADNTQWIQFQNSLPLPKVESKK